MHKPLLVYLACFGCVYGIALAIALLTNPSYFSNILGVFALICYCCTVLPGISRVIAPKWKSNVIKWLRCNRRQFGVAAFLFALNHGVLQIIKRDLDLFDPMTYAHYFQGFSMILILTLLAFTSSHEAVKHLRSNWQKLHRVTYLIILFLPWHIGDKMSGHWSQFTPFTLGISLLLVGLFVSRICKERLNAT
jgi:methionine sulfoxide reductase heme-binding subunit